MSGGVDSAVAALLLKQSGADVAAAYMKNWINEDHVLGDCPWQQDIEDARAAADAIGIELRVVNQMRDYRARIVDYLLDGYRHGLTPNPDAMCNREIKFGVFLDYARREGFDAVATGHYAIRRILPGGRCGVFESADANKDQTYFLALLDRAQVAAARFPIGELTKPRVREIARAAGLPNAGKKDSQGICFIGQVRMQDFLRHYVPDDPGDIVRVADGKILGRHRGLHFFTIGQRRGIGVPSNTDFENYVVVGRERATNRLLVAFEHPDAPGLWCRSTVVRDLRFLDAPIAQPQRLLVRVRYRDPAVPAFFAPLGDDRARIVFDQPQRALAAGQVIAFYAGGQLLGGAIYETVEPLVPLAHAPTPAFAPAAPA